MKPLPSFLLYCLLFLLACQSEKTPAEDAHPALSTLERCAASRPFLPGSTFVAPKEDLALGFFADSLSQGDGVASDFRTLEVFRISTCESLFRQTLPAHQPPGLHYEFAELVYNNTSRLIGIKGADRIWCYDIAEQRLLQPLIPQYKNSRNGLGGKPGLVRKLEVWEQYLIGYVEEAGVFLFDLRNPSSPRVLFPLAEYDIGEKKFHSLFALPLMPEGKLQLVIPHFDQKKNSLVVNPLFAQPVTSGSFECIPLTGEEGKFFLLQDEQGRQLADLGEMRLVPLPAKLQGADLETIRAWAAENTD